MILVIGIFSIKFNIMSVCIGAVYKPNYDRIFLVRSQSLDDSK